MIRKYSVLKWRAASNSKGTPFCFLMCNSNARANFKRVGTAVSFHSTSWNLNKFHRYSSWNHLNRREKSAFYQFNIFRVNSNFQSIWMIQKLESKCYSNWIASDKRELAFALVDGGSNLLGMPETSLSGRRTRMARRVRKSTSKSSWTIIVTNLRKATTYTIQH